MQRFRSIVGWVAGAAMIASSVMHSVLGWKFLKAGLRKARVDHELIRALAMGWHFAGAAMVAFGFIVVALFTHRLKGSTVSLRPAIVIGTTYVVYGAWALAVSGFDPFFSIFVVPGLMVLVASVGRRES
jgi:hypothetical protein